MAATIAPGNDETPDEWRVSFAATKPSPRYASWVEATATPAGRRDLIRWLKAVMASASPGMAS